MTGQQFGIPVYYDLGADNAQLKSRVAALLINMTGYIQKNKWYLIDITGNRTQWGVWNPTQLNNESFWYDERGINSMQILSYLVRVLRVSSFC